MRGKEYLPAISLDTCTDHPRLCGEKRVRSVHTFTALGSPPPMRGKGNERTEIFDRDRITPAYAGKSLSCSKRSCSKRDHPRLCGEKQLPQRRLHPPEGSPPPMRGKGFVIFRNIYRNRITPAYAGKSFARNVSEIFLRDHPRLCGEKQGIPSRLHSL